jgi:asparagine synthase (glutamine-hydrolysing)
LNASIGMTDSLQRRVRAFEATRDFDWVVGLQLWDFHVYLPDDLMVKTDRATMANGLEARSPFLDHRLIEWCAGMPSSLKVRGWNTKHILKESLKGLLPAEIINRPKQGFAVPVSAWFRGELREMGQDVLLSSSSVGRGYFRRDAIEELLRSHGRSQADHGYKLWALLNLELWHRRFTDPSLASPDRSTVARPS